MIFRRTNTKTLLMAGLIFLTIANLSRFFLPRFLGAHQDPLDLLLGTLTGIAIGLLLLFLIKSRMSGSR